jgi:mRNA interferase RelE/StbE
MKTIHSKNFARDLKKIKDKKILTLVANVIKAVESAPRLTDISNLEKLEGFKSAYRIRIGDYRLGCLCDAETVIFARFLHRKDIYRMFP